MPKAFTTVEKAQIRAQLMDRALNHFAKLGVRAARIDTLCAEVGIAKGSFYAFFDSKEDLFMTLAHERDRTHKREMLELVTGCTGTPEQALEQFFDFMMKRINEDPLLKILRNTGEITHLVRKVPAERLAQNTQRDREFMAEITEIMQHQHKIATATKQLLEDLLSIMLSTALQREHFEKAGNYNSVTTTLRDIFVTQMMKGSSQ